jgi:hypothetical protein
MAVRDICCAAGSVSKVIGLLAVDVMPDAMPRRQKGPRPGAMNAPDAVHMPHQMQRPEDRDRAGDDKDDDEGSTTPKADTCKGGSSYWLRVTLLPARMNVVKPLDLTLEVAPRRASTWWR